MSKVCIVDAVERFAAIRSVEINKIVGYDTEAKHSDGRAVSMNPEVVCRLLAIKGIPIYQTTYEANVKRLFLFHKGIFFDFDRAHAVYFESGLVYDVRTPFALSVAEYFEAQPVQQNILCLVRLTKQLSKELEHVLHVPNFR